MRLASRRPMVCAPLRSRGAAVIARRAGPARAHQLDDVADECPDRQAGDDSAQQTHGTLPFGGGATTARPPARRSSWSQRGVDRTSSMLVGLPAREEGPVSGSPAGSRLDLYVDRYAARTHGMTASEIRALFAVASRPEVVSLAGGMPNISGLPLDVVGSMISDAGGRARRGGPAVRQRPGRPAPARADLRGDAPGGHQRAPRRRGGHRRLAAGPRPGHPDLRQPRRRGARRGAVLRRRAGHVPGLPGRGRARGDGRRRADPRAPAPGDRRR